MLKSLEKRHPKKQETITGLYADLQSADTFGIDLGTLATLHRWDRLALRYYLTMRGYYEWKAVERIKKDKPEQPDEEFLKKLPGQKKAHNT